MRSFRWLSLALVVLAAGAADRAGAAYVLALEPEVSVVDTGDLLSIDIYLQQTDGDTGLNDGLIAAELRVGFMSSDLDALALVTGVTPNADFGDVFELVIDFPAGSFTGEVILRMTDLEGVFPTNDRILLGTLSVMARGPGTTLMMVSGFDPSPSFVNFATIEQDLVAESGTGSITVRDPGVIPEPASLALAGIGFLGALGLARFRRAV